MAGSRNIIIGKRSTLCETGFSRNIFALATSGIDYRIAIAASEVHHQATIYDTVGSDQSTQVESTDPGLFD